MGSVVCSDGHEIGQELRRGINVLLRVPLLLLHASRDSHGVPRQPCHQASSDHMHWIIFQAPSSCDTATTVLIKDPFL